MKKLFADINTMIEKSADVKSNMLRYNIGKALTEYYIKNQSNIKNQNKDTEEDILKLFNFYNIDKESLDAFRNKKTFSWEKIKKVLSEALSKKYGGNGYSTTNIGYMQQFYKKYRNSPESLEKALQLDWSHNVTLLKDRLNDDERKFYLKKAISEKWSVKELDKQVADESYDVFLSTIENCNFKFNIDRIEINNYKSLVDLKITNPSQFLVFAGANATGKSSIFEAFEFLMHTAMTTGNIALDIFGGSDKIVNYTAQLAKGSKNSMLSINLILSFGDEENKQNISFGIKYDFLTNKLTKEFTGIPTLDNRIIESFSHIFIDNNKRAENKIKLYNKLWLDASNTNKILKTILSDKSKKPEFIEWLQVLIPELEKVTVEKDLSGKEELLVYEKTFLDKPFAGNLISEGTYNIIALLTLFYQSNEPQFICIEEPETGLNPAILKELVPFFREMTQKYHHHIWVTTHSVSLVAELVEEELLIVNKKNGITQVHQCKQGDFEEMKPDEAWMSNMLKGGGLPW